MAVAWQHHTKACIIQAAVVTAATTPHTDNQSELVALYHGPDSPQTATNNTEAVLNHSMYSTKRIIATMRQHQAMACVTPREHYLYNTYIVTTTMWQDYIP